MEAVPAAPSPAPVVEAPSASPTTTPVEPTPVPETNPASTPTPATEGTSLESTPDATPNSEESPAPNDPFKTFAKDKEAGVTTDAKTTEVGQNDPLTDVLTTEPTDWKEALPQAYKDDSYLSRFDSMESFLKGVKNLQQLASKKGLERPAPDAPPEAWNDYWETVGRPTNPEDYNIEDIKDSMGETQFEFNREELKEMYSDLHKEGYTNSQAQLMMNKFAQREMASAQAKEAQAEQQRTQTLTNLQADFKDSTDAMIRRSLNALEGLGIYDALVQGGVETNEAVIRAGIKLSSEFSEAVTGPQGSIKTSVDSLTEIEGSKAFLNKNDPNHKQAVAKRDRLLKEIHNV